jgi:hypothetical protein
MSHQQAMLIDFRNDIARLDRLIADYRRRVRHEILWDGSVVGKEQVSQMLPIHAQGICTWANQYRQ